jgi:hypothetical protein
MARTEIVAGALVRSRVRSYLWSRDDLYFDEIKTFGRSQFLISGPRDSIARLETAVKVMYLEQRAAQERAEAEAERQRQETWRNRWYAPWRRRKAATA